MVDDSEMDTADESASGCAFFGRKRGANIRFGHFNRLNQIDGQNKVFGKILV